MPRKSKKASTATTTIHSIPFPVDDPFTDRLDVREYSLADLQEEQEASREPMQPVTLHPSETLPVSTAPQRSPDNQNEPLAQNLKATEAPMSEYEEEHRHYMNSEYCRDWGVREGESIPPDWKGPPIGRKVIQTPTAGTNVPIATIALPGPAAAPEVIYPKITRHKGQRTQTCKNIFTSVTIQHRKALDLLRDKTRKSLKEVLCEAIADCAVKHGLASTPASILGWPDWD